MASVCFCWYLRQIGTAVVLKSTLSFAWITEGPQNKLAASHGTSFSIDRRGGPDTFLARSLRRGPRPSL